MTSRSVDMPWSVADPGTRVPSVPVWRIAGERLLRGIAIASVLWAVWGLRGGAASREGLDGARVRSVAQRDLRSALTSWSTGAAPRDVALTLTSVPDVGTRAWLAALVRGGMRVQWRPGDSAHLVPTAIAVEPKADPSGETRVAVAAPAGTRITLADDVGPIDTMTTAGVGVAFEGPPPIGLSAASVPGAVARAGRSDSLVLRHLLVLGRVGWESKFLVRALEEDGWTVDVRLMVTPRAVVREGTAVSLDTAHYAAALVVGELGQASEQGLLRYVRSGGGLLLMDGAASRIPSLAVGASGAEVRVPWAPSTNGGQAVTTPLVPVVNLRSDGVAIERRDTHVAVALRPVASGYVEQIGYRDTWRWRMVGGDSGVGAHRRWWAARVADIAYAPAVPLPTAVSANPAPLVAWYDAFGAATRASLTPGTPLRAPLAGWLFAVAVLALLAEWSSRRVRGAA